MILHEIIEDTLYNVLSHKSYVQQLCVDLVIGNRANDFTFGLPRSALLTMMAQ